MNKYKLSKLFHEYDVFTLDTENSINDFLTFSKTNEIEIGLDKFILGLGKDCISEKEIRNFRLQKKLDSFKRSKNQALINTIIRKNDIGDFFYMHTPGSGEERIYVEVSAEDEQKTKVMLIKQIGFTDEIFSLNLVGLVFYNSGKVEACFAPNEKCKDIAKEMLILQSENNIADLPAVEKVLASISEGSYVIMNRNSMIETITPIPEEIVEEEVLENSEPETI